MKKLISLLMALLVCGVAAKAQVINVPNSSFSAGSTPMTLNGTATVVGGDLRVSTGTLISVGSAFWNTPIDVSQGFDTTFSFRVTVTSGSGGSGMTFLIHGDSAGLAAIGSPAHALGYAQTLAGNPVIANCLALEIDLFQDANKNDPSSSHLSLHTSGTGNGDQNENTSIGSYTTPSDLSDGNVHTIRVHYVPGLLEIYLDNSAAPVISTIYDFATGGTYTGGGSVGGLALFSNKFAYVGFTGSSPNTTAQLEHHDVTAWTFNTLTPPSFPGNATDFDCGVSVNGVLSTQTSGIIGVSGLDLIGLHYSSPNGGTNGRPMSAFYQLFLTGTSLFSFVIPGEPAPGGFWLDLNGTNTGAITGIVPYLDGLALGGPSHLAAPVLLPTGFDYGFVVPPSLTGQNFSLMLQAVIDDPGLNVADLGIGKAIELKIN